MSRRSASVVVMVMVMVALVLTGCGGDASSSTVGGIEGIPAEVHVFAASVTPHGDQADATVELHNGGDAEDRLIAVACACAMGAEIHGADATGDVGPVDGVSLPPDEVVRFSPGGPHIVLVGLTRPLAAGDTVTLTFTFEHAPAAEAVAEVTEAKEPSPA
jgi:copper(I)-binding protein